MHALRRSRSDPGICRSSRSTDEEAPHESKHTLAGDTVSRGDAIDLNFIHVFGQETQDFDYPFESFGSPLPLDSTIPEADIDDTFFPLPMDAICGLQPDDLTLEGEMLATVHSKESRIAADVWQDEPDTCYTDSENEFLRLYIWRANPIKQSFLSVEETLAYNRDHAECVGCYQYSYDWRGVCSGSDPLEKAIDAIWRDFVQLDETCNKGDNELERSNDNDCLSSAVAPSTIGLEFLEDFLCEPSVHRCSDGTDSPHDSVLED